MIRIEGQATLASAGELKAVLLEWLCAGKDLHLDLGGAEEIDIPVMQLLWAAAREAARTGVEITCRASKRGCRRGARLGFRRGPWVPDFRGEP